MAAQGLSDLHETEAGAERPNDTGKSTGGSSETALAVFGYVNLSKNVNNKD